MDSVFFVFWMEYSILFWKYVFIKGLVREGKWWMNWYCFVIFIEIGCVFGDVCLVCLDDGLVIFCKFS